MYHYKVKALVEVEYDAEYLGDGKCFGRSGK